MKYDITRVTNRTLIFAIILNLLILFMYVTIFDMYKHVKLSEINMNLLGEKVEVCGYVYNIRRTPKYLSFYLTDALNNSIYVVFFNKVNVENQDFKCLEGVVKIYNKKLEIIGDRLR